MGFKLTQCQNIVEEPLGRIHETYDLHSDDANHDWYDLTSIVCFM